MWPPFYNIIIDEKLDRAYKENLIKLGQTGTLIAVAENS